MKTDGFSPDGVVRGPVRVPGSKSIAQRALAAAAFAHGTTELVGLPSSDDVLHALRAARAVGARFPSEARPDDLLQTALLRRSGHGRLAGAPPTEHEAARPWVTVDVGESGTTARLFTALLALARPAGSGAELVASGTLARRRSRALFAALRAAGAGVEHGAGATDGWPVLLTAPPRVRALRLESPTSSQEVSALLMALGCHAGTSTLDVVGALPSAPYVELTRELLARFGVGVEEAPPSGGAEEVRRFVVGGPLRAPGEPVVIEPDASSAAVALAAACLTGGEAWVDELGAASWQPDVAVVELLTAFGCDARREPTRLVAGGRPRAGIDIDLARTPDLAPVAAALAADVAQRGIGVTRLTGLGTLQGKESPRLTVLARGLAAVGLDATHGPDWLQVAPSTRGRGSSPRAAPVVLDPAGDHRMAFAFALLGCFLQGVRVADPGCVAKSWPSFWADLAAAGASRAQA